MSVGLSSTLADHLLFALAIAPAGSVVKTDSTQFTTANMARARAREEAKTCKEGPFLHCSPQRGTLQGQQDRMTLLWKAGLQMILVHRDWSQTALGLQTPRQKGDDSHLDGPQSLVS